MTDKTIDLKRRRGRRFCPLDEGIMISAPKALRRHLGPRADGAGRVILINHDNHGVAGADPALQPCCQCNLKTTIPMQGLSSARNTA
jgi:hypothetical protein